MIPYRFRSKKLKMLKDAITLKFRTTSRDGVLLHGEGQQGDYISLELQRARLQLSINLGRRIEILHGRNITCPIRSHDRLLLAEEA